MEKFHSDKGNNCVDKSYKTIDKKTKINYEVFNNKLWRRAITTKYEAAKKGKEKSPQANTYDRSIKKVEGSYSIIRREQLIKLLPDPQSINSKPKIKMEK